MIDLLIAGGWPMIPIVICSIILVAITLERFWALRASSVLPRRLQNQAQEWAQKPHLEHDQLTALQSKSALGRMYATVFTSLDLPNELSRERLEDTGRHVAHDLSKFLPSLGTIALIAPLLGLLGTVIGLIDMFLAQMSHQITDNSVMAAGIGQALICTASGLVVAIPAYILHRYFRSRVAGLCIELEQATNLLKDRLIHQQNASQSRDSR